jgi:hypothetical protein
MLAHAFKEWAVICQALAEGRQALILRKGGIAEESGEFRLEHARFWLFPTYAHQQKAGIKPEALALLEQVEANRPLPGVHRLTHLAEVAGVYCVQDLASALCLNRLHLWSAQTVAARFEYRRPGLYVLPVRAYRAAEAFELPDTADYAGCRTWVELDRALPTEGASPVLSDDAFRDVMKTLDARLNPSALT